MFSDFILYFVSGSGDVQPEKTICIRYKEDSPTNQMNEANQTWLMIRLVQPINKSINRRIVNYKVLTIDESGERVFHDRKVISGIESVSDSHTKVISSNATEAASASTGQGSGSDKNIGEVNESNNYGRKIIPASSDCKVINVTLHETKCNSSSESKIASEGKTTSTLNSSTLNSSRNMDNKNTTFNDTIPKTKDLGDPKNVVEHQIGNMNINKTKNESAIGSPKMSLNPKAISNGTIIHQQLGNRTPATAGNDTSSGSQAIPGNLTNATDLSDSKIYFGEPRSTARSSTNSSTDFNGTVINDFKKTVEGQMEDGKSTNTKNFNELSITSPKTTLNGTTITQVLKNRTPTTAGNNASSERQAMQGNVANATDHKAYVNNFGEPRSAAGNSTSNSNMFNDTGTKGKDLGDSHSRIQEIIMNANKVSKPDRENKTLNTFPPEIITDSYGLVIKVLSEEISEEEPALPRARESLDSVNNASNPGSETWTSNSFLDEEADNSTSGYGIDSTNGTDPFGVRDKIGIEPLYETISHNNTNDLPTVTSMETTAYSSPTSNSSEDYTSTEMVSVNEEVSQVIDTADNQNSSTSTDLDTAVTPTNDDQVNSRIGNVTDSPNLTDTVITTAANMSRSDNATEYQPQTTADLESDSQAEHTTVYSTASSTAATTVFASTTSSTEDADGFKLEPVVDGTPESPDERKFYTTPKPTQATVTTTGQTSRADEEPSSVLTNEVVSTHIPITSSHLSPDSLIAPSSPDHSSNQIPVLPTTTPLTPQDWEIFNNFTITFPIRHTYRRPHYYSPYGQGIYYNPYMQYDPRFLQYDPRYIQPREFAPYP